ncbi:MAG: hypothetical protein PHX78_08345 [bacterium]|nr:hypothetical protein [bacterium]
MKRGIARRVSGKKNPAPFRDGLLRPIVGAISISNYFFNPNPFVSNIGRDYLWAFSGIYNCIPCPFLFTIYARLK